jgi:hypothetical protein
MEARHQEIVVMRNWTKKWVPVLSLALAPVAFAENTGAMETAGKATVTTSQSATSSDVQEQKIAELQKEVDALRAETAKARQANLDAQATLGDPNDHPLWP